MKICWAGTCKENHCPSGFLLSSKINFKNPHAPREACAFDMAYMKIVNDMYDSIKGLCESWIAIIKKYLCLCCIFFWQRNISSSYFFVTYLSVILCSQRKYPLSICKFLELIERIRTRKGGPKNVKQIDLFFECPEGIGL